MDTNLGRVIGYDGKQIELSRDSLYIKWRYVGDAVWKNLIALNDLKVGLPKGGKTDQVLAKLSNNDWDYVWKTPESGGGSIDTVPLASVTTAPVAPFPINTKYYNANDNIIYRATEENTWENADTEEPILGAFYIYDDEIYFYDKKSQSLYMVKTIPSTIFYANKIMEAGESNINMEVDLSNSLILSVHVNGHFQTYGKNYTISTENEESTIYFDESVDEDSEVDVVYSSYMELSGGGGVSDYSQLTNKPKINNIELKGNKTSDNLGLQDKITTDNKLSVNLVSGLAQIATSGSYNDLSNKPTVDDTLSDNSENAVQNKVIKAAIDEKATSSTTLSGYGITDAYTKTEVDTSLSNKQASLSETQLSAVNSGITSSKVTTYDNYSINKQDTLVSGTNIKTINNNSILGSGNIEITTGEKQIITLPTTSSTVTLSTNNTYIFNVDDFGRSPTITINLTTPQNLNINNNILLHLVGVHLGSTFNWGTTYFFNDETPTIEHNGCYDVCYVWHPTFQVWICKVVLSINYDNM